MAAAYGLGRAFSFLGPLPTPDVIGWRHASQVFMLPSLAEGTPTVLLEAQATGLPVLATDVGGVRDIVPPGAGFVVPAADPDALPHKFALLTHHPAPWPALRPVAPPFVQH